MLHESLVSLFLINSLNIMQDSYFGIGQEVLLSRKIYGPIVDDVSLSSCCFGTLLVRSSSFLLTCGHWDNSFKVISLDGGDMVQSNSQHKDVVTSLSGCVLYNTLPVVHDSLPRYFFALPSFSCSVYFVTRIACIQKFLLGAYSDKGATSIILIYGGLYQIWL